MQYLVEMKLVPQTHPTTNEEGTAFIEQYIFLRSSSARNCKTRRRFPQADLRAPALGSCSS